MTDNEKRISPCAFPGCRDRDDNPRLTQEVFCEPCRARYRRVLDWIVEDFAVLKVTMPQPVTGKGWQRRGKSVSFGHPAAWASDGLAEIAAVLNAVEDELRDVNGHGKAPTAAVSETLRVRHAHRYLAVRFEDLCSYGGAVDTATELTDLHRKVYSGLGMTKLVEKLPVPCPDCDLVRMVRIVGRVYCQECGLSYPDDQYPRLALIVASDVVAARDRQLDEWLARRAELAI